MAAIVMRFPMLPGEEHVDFLRRRSRLAMAQCRLAGEWHLRYAARVCAWQDHLARPANARSWAACLMHHRGKNWLIARRLLAGSPLVFGGRAGTRTLLGCVNTRWHDGAELARSML